MSLTKIDCSVEGYNSSYWHVSTKIGDSKVNYLFTESQLKAAHKRAVKLALEPKQRLSWWDRWMKAKQL